jgi:hypothetical protein
MELYVKIHDAEIIDNKIVINKIVIVDETGKIIREAQMNNKLLELIKDIHTNTRYQEIKDLWKKEFGDEANISSLLTIR